MTAAIVNLKAKAAITPRPFICALPKETRYVKPVLQALLVADHVYEDKRTGKKIVVGIFDRLLFKAQPESATGPTAEQEKEPPVIKGGMHAGSPYAYLNITDVHGTVKLELRYVDLSDRSALFRTELSVKCDDPLATVELILPMPPLPTPHPGVYALELLADGDPMGSHRITVEELVEEGQ
jgi:hypothetical protein